MGCDSCTSEAGSQDMDKYEQLSVVGEGSYGVVLKCRRRDTGQLVAIKKFLETEEDAAVRKMALREIRMLKKLRHEHLVNMIEVFRRKRRFYLVFEYLDHTLLDELDAATGGLGEETAKKHLYQLLKGIDYCHQNAIIHRDVKPENVLVSNEGIVKLCDLGFARALAAPGEPYTEYVATRWYRAPELLVAEHRYGPEVDIWAIGCLFAEMLTGDPLFPGDSDIDQLALIIKVVGKLAPRHQQVVSRLAGGAALSATGTRATLPGTGYARELLAACLRTEPRARPPAHALLRHKYFTFDGFTESFNAELRKKLGKEIQPTASQHGSSRPPKARQQWTLNIIPDHSSSRTNSTTAESLIDYNYTPGSESVESGPAPDERLAPIGPTPPSLEDSEAPTPVLQPAEAPPPLPKPAQPPAPPKTLARAINETFQDLSEAPGTFRGVTDLKGSQKVKDLFLGSQTFPVPVTTYPRTPYIKKVNNKLMIDEDLLRGKGKKKNNKTKTSTDFSLPYVPGASNSPMKKVKKPHAHAHALTTRDKATETQWEPSLQRSGGSDARTPTNLPYM